MTVWNCPIPIQNPPQVPWNSIAKSWHGKVLLKPARFLFWLDADALHFACAHDAPAKIHPLAEAGKFQGELWRYDVGEYFLAALDGSYLEVNLAPNGAWWLALFDKKRQLSDKHFSRDGVTTKAKMTPDSWQAQITIPLENLSEFFPDLTNLSLNAAFILQSPDQIFLTACPLESPEPDFHLPEQFPKIELKNLPIH